MKQKDFYTLMEALVSFPQLAVLTILLSFFQNSLSTVDPYFEACGESRKCGDGPNISYPFWIDGLQNSSCGYPGFRVTCSENRPILSLSDNTFVIREIFYDNQSLRVVNTRFLDSPSLCYPSIHDLNLKGTPFNLTSEHSDLVLAYNCSRSLSGNFSSYEVMCLGDDLNGTVLAILKGDSNSSYAAELGCSENEVVAPVDRFEEDVGDGWEDYWDMLGRGFLLSWTAGKCNACQESKGYCGFDYQMYQFRCFCKDRPHTYDCSAGNNKHVLVLAISFACLGLVICLIIFFVYRRYYKKKHVFPNFFFRKKTSTDPPSKPDLEKNSVYFGIPVFTYGELEEATNSFDTGKELGDGGFGTVYHGKLRDGREVAVKRLYEHNYKRVEQFINEIEILTRLRHKNLVTLYGCTSRHSRELILVYEYVPNGTVADHLHGEGANPNSLTWPIRMKIAVQTAAALTYLHASDIIHRDVKTNNILLDSGFNVKVADFGMSRLFPTDVTHVSTAPQGTPGYVDPEYHQSYQLTEKSDVYSFGVVLVELLSSLPAVDISRHRHEINLSNLAINKIQNREYEDLVDPSLGFERNGAVKRMITSVAELAFQCLQYDKENRPSMEKVLVILKKIESGECEVGREEEVNDGIEELNIMAGAPPPPSPENDDVGLLKKLTAPVSPNSLTDKWGSSRSSSTPNASR